MNELKIFNSPEFGQVRTITLDGEPWFVGKDVADALGYSNSRDALARHVDDEDKTSVVIPDTGSNYKSKTTLINESGLYSLVLSSKLPTAKKFKHWVTSEVLPAIRKHGGYMTPEKVEEALLNPDTLIKLATELKAEREARKHAELEAAIAKDYGMSAKALNQKLHELRVIYRMGSQWFLYAKYQAKGYTHSKTFDFKHSDGRPDCKMQTEWTQKGRLFLYQLLKKHGVLPMIERDDQEAGH